MNPVRLSTEARDFLRAEAGFLRDRNPGAAVRFVERMEQARRNLADIPMMGSEGSDGPVPDTRHLVAGDYVLIYRLTENETVVLSIRHGRMAPPA